ncbi:hypothetical protein DXG01_013892 [Tephrocybe rancida]|nr:hypothetical protein DXG01_013892 [Tephrocybe rancida]
MPLLKRTGKGTMTQASPTRKALTQPSDGLHHRSDTAKVGIVRLSMQDNSNARNELFAGYDISKTGSGRFLDGPVLAAEPMPTLETEEDIEGIKRQTRYVKQESLKSARNAVQLARQAEETARSTLARVGKQSDKLANAERDFDLAYGHAARAADRTDELRQLNRSIFRPVITFDNESDHITRDMNARTRYDEQRREREALRDTQQRLGLLAGPSHREATDVVTNTIHTRHGVAEKHRRRRFQFEATESDDELEEELERNLGDVGDAARQLRSIATAINDEVDRQSGAIDRMSEQTGDVRRRLEFNTYQSRFVVLNGKPYDDLRAPSDLHSE